MKWKIRLKIPSSLQMALSSASSALLASTSLSSSLSALQEGMKVSRPQTFIVRIGQDEIFYPSPCQASEKGLSESTDWTNTLLVDWALDQVDFGLPGKCRSVLINMALLKLKPEDRLGSRPGDEIAVFVLMTR